MDIDRIECFNIINIVLIVKYYYILGILSFKNLNNLIKLHILKCLENIYISRNDISSRSIYLELCYFGYSVIRELPIFCRCKSYSITAIHTRLILTCFRMLCLDQRWTKLSHFIQLNCHV